MKHTREIYFQKHSGSCCTLCYREKIVHSVGGHNWNPVYKISSKPANTQGRQNKELHYSIYLGVGVCICCTFMDCGPSKYVAVWRIWEVCGVSVSTDKVRWQSAAKVSNNPRGISRRYSFILFTVPEPLRSLNYFTKCENVSKQLQWMSMGTNTFYS